MGGKAVLNVVRAPKEAYHYHAKWFKQLFDSKFPEHANTSAFPDAYREKESFGDFDFLTTLPKDKFVQFLEKMNEQGVLLLKDASLDSFGVQFPLADGSGFSPMYQLDHLKTTNEHFTFHRNYLSWNDLGNFMGRVAAYYGLKFGADGLYCHLYLDQNGTPLKVSKYKSKNNEEDSKKVFHKTHVFMSLDWNKVLTFLGFDAERYAQGFDNMDDVAQFVYNNPFFNTKMFDLQDRDNKSRARDSKRPNYDYVSNKFAELAQLDLSLQPKRYGVCLTHWLM